MKTLIKIVAPLLLLGLAVAIVVYLLRTREEPTLVTPDRPVPPVVVSEVLLETERPIIEANGTLRPRHNLNLRAEVAGTIVEIAPEMEPGMFVEAGTLLVKLAPEDFRSVVAARRAELAEAEVALAEEIARGAQAEREWQRLGRSEEPTPLTLRVPQRERAEARVASAKATLEAAERDLERTRIKAPFDSIVAERVVSPGEVLSTPGAPLGRIVSVANPEIRISVPVNKLHLIPIPGAHVRLSSGPDATLEGRVRARAPELEGSTRLAELLIEVANNRSNIPLGTFLRATIEGEPVENLARLPRLALRGNDSVWVVNADKQVEIRRVEVIQRTRDEVLIGAGLETGDRVVISPLPFFSDGMTVEIVSDSAEMDSINR